MNPRIDSGLSTHCNKRIRHFLRRGADNLSAEGRETVRQFILDHWNEDGGFQGRSPKSDLYYTVFGLECAVALELELHPGIRQYLQSLAVEGLDFVHLTCLARCLEIAWPGFAADQPETHRLIKTRVLAHVCQAGGFHARPGPELGTVYDSFLGMLACESLGECFPAPGQMLKRLGQLRKASGGFFNDSAFGAASTPVTAAALGLYGELRHSPPGKSLDWLMARLCRNGGFSAGVLVPWPDLLSTATALHALNTHGCLQNVTVTPSLEFITDLWAENGGFRGHLLDGKADCEYTFYALLSLGNLVMA